MRPSLLCPLRRGVPIIHSIAVFDLKDFLARAGPQPSVFPAPLTLDRRLQDTPDSNSVVHAATWYMGRGQASPVHTLSMGNLTTSGGAARRSECKGCLTLTDPTAENTRREAGSCQSRPPRPTKEWMPASAGMTTHW